MKENKKSSGFMISTVAFCIAVIVGLPLRTYQYFTNINSDGTGFYRASNDWTVYAVYGVLAICVMISIASALIYKSELGYDRDVKKRPVLGLVSIIAALSTLLHTSVSIINLLPIFTGTATEPKGVLNFYLPVVEGVFGAIAAIYFVVFAMSVLSGSSNASEYKILSLAPSFWLAVRLCSYFSTKIAFIKVSDLLFEILMLVFMLAFFVAFAQLNSKIESKGLDWKLVGYGLPAALLALICFVPRVIITVFGGAGYIYPACAIEYCDIGTALFTLSVVLSRIGWMRGNADDVDEAAEKAKAEKESEESNDR